MRRRVEQIRQLLGVAWLPWAVGHVIVLGTLALARFEVSHFGIRNAGAVTASHQGLLSFDGAWFLAIASHGYRANGIDSVRFFPGYPLAARFLHEATALPTRDALLVIAAVFSLAATMALCALARSEFGDPAVERRAAWLFNLAPSAFVLVMGYSEPLFLFCAISCFVCVRRGNWWWAAALGLMAGATRPIGCLLAVAIAVEVVPRLRSSGWRRALPKLAALFAPIVTTAAYLTWVSSQFHDFFAPFTVQFNVHLHGAASNPATVVWKDIVEVKGGHHLFVAALVATIVLSLALLVVVLTKLPVSYGVFAGLVILAGLSGQNLNSFPRYAWSAFPLILGGAAALRSDRWALVTFCLCVAGMVGLGLVSFLGAYVP